MVNSKVLLNKERETIFKLFFNNTKLKFSEIEKLVNTRSNKLAYHLDKLVKEGLIKKEKYFYVLTD